MCPTHSSHQNPIFQTKRQNKIEFFFEHKIAIHFYALDQTFFLKKECVRYEKKAE